jgi:DNA polymerase bacteriophage-type
MYWGKDQKTKQWCWQKIYGGKWVENGDQAISRDLLLGGLLRAEARGLTPVGHTHDEIICEVDVESRFGLPDLIDCMIKPFDWCVGLILGAEGYETTGPYRKD